MPTMGRCYLEPIVNSGNSALRAIVFDGDDTLWSTEPLYDKARDEARSEVARSGLDGEKWEQLERRFDVANVRHFGFGIERFPTSCVQAYEAVAKASDVPVDPEVRERVRSAARTVFSQDPALIPGARETLRHLRARGVKLALLTKGAHELQERRVERSGLAELFDFVRIVAEKQAAEFNDIVTKLEVEPHNAWSVGNSIRSDIIPAIEAGLRAVWIDAHVWEHERFDGSFAHNRLVVVDDISRVAQAIDVALMEDPSHA
jgi:putative hydrolase of the HAD superfamily